MHKEVNFMHQRCELVKQQIIVELNQNHMFKDLIGMQLKWQGFIVAKCTDGLGKAGENVENKYAGFGQTAQHTHLD